MYIQVTRTITDLSAFTLECEGLCIDHLSRDDVRFLRRELREALRVAKRMEKGEFPDAITLNETRAKPKPFRSVSRETIGVDVYIFAEEDEVTEFALALTLGRQTVNIEPLTREDAALLINEITQIL